MSSEPLSVEPVDRPVAVCQGTNSPGNAQPSEHPRATGHGGFAAVCRFMSARAAVIGLNAGTGIVTARSLNVEGRGQLSAMILWSVLLSNAMTLGLPSALTFNINRDRRSESRLVGAAILLSVAVNALAALVAAACLPRALHLYSPETIFYAQCFLLNAPIAMLLQISRSVFEARNDFVTSSRSQWLMPLANLFGLLALLPLHRFTPTSAAIVYVFCSTPFAFWVFAKLWRDCRPSFESLKEPAASLLSYGLRSYGIDLCGTLSLYVDQALVVGLLSAHAMGTYVVALSLSRMLNMCHSSVVVVLFPKSVGRSMEEIMHITASAARLSTSVTLLAGVFVAVFGPIILRTLYGAEYATAADILKVLIAEVVIGGLVSVLSQAPMALGRPGVVTLLQGLGLGLTVPLLLILVPRYGLLGAGYALLISTSCRLLFIMITFPCFLRVQPPNLLLTRSDFDAVLSGARIFGRRFRPLNFDSNPTASMSKE